jgi:hypothetical protein
MEDIRMKPPGDYIVVVGRSVGLASVSVILNAPLSATDYNLVARGIQFSIGSDYLDMVAAIMASKNLNIDHRPHTCGGDADAQRAGSDCK